MPTYDDLKAAIVAEAESIGEASLLAALGDQGDSPPWPTVVVAVYLKPDPNDLTAPPTPTEIRVLKGSAFAPPADPEKPEDGPDPERADQTVIATIVRGVAAYLESEWKPRINATIQVVNAEHSTSLEEVP